MNSHKLANSSKKFSTDELRSFYFSKATNYDSFATSKKNTASSPLTENNTTINRNNNNTTTLGASAVDVSAISNTAVATPIASASTAEGAKRHPAPLTAASPAVFASTPSPAATATTAGSRAPAAGSALAAARKNNTNTANNTTTANVTLNNNNNASQSSAAAGGSSGDGVSPAYVEFLRQQQDLVKYHCAIDEIVASVTEFAAARREEEEQKLKEAYELLHIAEQSSNWNWKSQYSAPTLAKDAQLELTDDLLKHADDLPNVSDLQHQQQLLVRIKQQYCVGPAAEEEGSMAGIFKPTLENGIRRFDRLIKEFGASQLDASALVRTSDDIVVQLDHVLGQQQLSELLRDVNDRILVISNNHRECRAARDHAHEEGIMDVEERESYRLADLGEELANAQAEKVKILSRLLDEVNVNVAVRDAYDQKSQEGISKLEAESEDLKARCERDLARLYQLKKQVDDAEKLMLEKTDRDRAQSDAVVEDLMTRQSEAWDQVATLLKLIRQLELERHQEIKKRMESKLKDEKRRIEYSAFNVVFDKQATNYDRTVLNCDTSVHCAKLMGEFLHSGFFMIDKGLKQRGVEVSDALLEAQKAHLETYRTLLFTLGDLEYRKERKAAELGENIQAAHIQQELCNDSLNPNAKKFSDAKKDLLRLRDEVQIEIRDIRDRQQAATEQFQPTEEALISANVPHAHPLQELEDRRLNTRAKMVEYKAMALGRSGAAPVKKELDSLREGLNETRKVITSRSAALGGGNNSTMGSIL